MPRIATGNEVKLNVVITSDDNQKIQTYLKLKEERYGKKISKIEASSDVMIFGLENIDIEIQRLSKEIKEINDKIEKLKS